jgi:cytochrome c peroxidase
VRKTIFIISVACLPLAFLVKPPTINPNLEAAQAYIELLPNGKFEEAAVVFDNLSKKTGNPNFKRAAAYIRTHNSTENFDFAFFYRQILNLKTEKGDPSVSVFNWAFSERKNGIQNEKLDEKRAELGHLLFYDPILSANVKRSCASCHRPEKAFSDQRTTSRAFKFAENLDKNAPSLINATQQTRFFHEGNHRELPQVFEAVIKNAKEFNNSYEIITAHLNSSAEYLALLKTAFPNKTSFNRAEIDESLVQFLKILRGYDSPFDRFMNDSKTTTAPSFVEGFNLFMGKAQCGTCHRMPSFGGSQLPFSDEHLVHQIDDKQLKTPSLRNVNLTFPYLYNGKMNDILTIFDEPFHFKTLLQKQVVLLPTERNKIIAFLNNLNDAPILQANEPASLPHINNFETRTIGGKY